MRFRLAYINETKGSITFGRQNLTTAKLDTAAVFAQKKKKKKSDLTPRVKKIKI